MVIYRQARLDDTAKLCKFTDFWLAGRGMRVNAPGAVDDYFLSPSQHRKYITKYYTLLALEGQSIVGWAVLEPSRTLIALLVAGNRRCRGIGKAMMLRLQPDVVRSKSNQSSGDPKSFYLHLGFELKSSERSRSRLDISVVRPERPKTIDVFRSATPWLKNPPEAGF